jgi:hypothetical protein
MINGSRPSEKSFGITFGVLFIIAFVYFFIVYNKINYLLILISFIFIFFSFFFKKIFIVPNLLWFKFGQFLNKIISPILYLIVFYFLIFPISLFIKLSSIRKKNKKISNWVLHAKNKDIIKVDFNKQF